MRGLMTVRLVEEGWGEELREALRVDPSHPRIICPFIKVDAIEMLLSLQSSSIQVVTRFNLADSSEGVSDVAALRGLLGANASVRGVRNLHAKLYLFRNSRAIITSANLTVAALSVTVEYLLIDFHVGDETLPVSHQLRQRGHCPVLVRVRRPHEVHRHVGVDEDHGSRWPASIS